MNTMQEDHVSPKKILRIGLMGYGKMGKEVETYALKQGDEIVWKADSKSIHHLNLQTIQKADVIIEFSQPEAALQNIRMGLSAGVRVISGTTGWTESMPAVIHATEENQTAFIHASNFSIGVNIFFAINRFASRLLSGLAAYTPGIAETHHIHKKDKPSGTAISLAKQIIDSSSGEWTNWHLEPEEGNARSIPIQSSRQDEVPGTHTVIWQGDNDKIQLLHEAQTRTGFAAGAWLAAHWIRDKKGIFEMCDVLGIGKNIKKEGC